jgi:hypothetical protein
LASLMTGSLLGSAVLPTGLLAFGFAAPWLLWGLLFAAAPVLIHLLYQRRYRETPWAAMQFLMAAAKRQSRWSRLDHWLLLLVRTLIPLAAALALAGPIWDLLAGGAGPAPMHRVLIVDVSLSTQVVEEGRPRAARLREAALELVREGRPGDTWQLFVLGGPRPRGIIAEPTFLPETVVEELRQLVPTFGRGSLVDGLRPIVEALQGAPPGPRTVYLLTDGQRSQWHPDSEGERSELVSLLAALDERARVVWLDGSRQAVGNVAVTNLNLSEPYVMLGQPLRLVATLRRFGEATFPPTLTWRMDGRVVANTPIPASSEPELTVELRYTPSAPGELRASAVLPNDALAADNERHAVCVVREAIRLLLVDGRPSGEPFQNATDALRLAMALEGDRTPTRGLLPRVVTDGELLATNLDDYDLVWLCDVPRLTEREGEWLAEYTRRGGGTILSLGPSVQTAAYNAVLGRPERSFLPAKLGELVGDPVRREPGFPFAAAEFAHPILAPFRGNPNTGFELTQTYAYLRALPASAAERAVDFENGDPAILTQPFGRGRVVLITTAVDRTWGTWAVWGHTFVPMVHELVEWQLADRYTRRQVEVGTPLSLSGRGDSNRGGTQLRLPDDRVVPVIAPDDGPSDATWDDTADPGFYAWEGTERGSPTLWYAINPPAVESDPTPLAPGELRDGLFGGRPFDAPAETTELVDAGRVGPGPTKSGTLPRWLLGFALLLLVAEPFLTWHRGLALMILLGLIATTLAAMVYGPTGAVMAGLASLLGIIWWALRRNPTVISSV